MGFYAYADFCRDVAAGFAELATCARPTSPLARAMRALGPRFTRVAADALRIATESAIASGVQLSMHGIRAAVSDVLVSATLSVVRSAL